MTIIKATYKPLVDPLAKVVPSEQCVTSVIRRICDRVDARRLW